MAARPLWQAGFVVASAGALSTSTQTYLRLLVLSDGSEVGVSRARRQHVESAITPR